MTVEPKPLTMLESLRAIADCAIDGKMSDAIEEMKQLAREAIESERLRRIGPEPSMDNRVTWAKWYRATTGASFVKAIEAYHAKASK